jgi:integrase
MSHSRTPGGRIACSVCRLIRASTAPGVVLDRRAYSAVVRYSTSSSGHVVALAPSELLGDKLGDDRPQRLDEQQIEPAGHGAAPESRSSAISRSTRSAPSTLTPNVAAKTAAGLSPKTIANHVDGPRLDDPDTTILTEEEVAALLKTYVELAFRAESLDEDLLEQRLHVRQSWVRNEMTTPKSRSSRRTVAFGLKTKAALEEQFRASRCRGDDELVFGHPDLGTPLDPAELTRSYVKPALRKAGTTKKIQPWHGLRHTALTIDAATGAPNAYVHAKAGHSTFSIAERYVHAAQVAFLGRLSAARSGCSRRWGRIDARHKDGARARGGAGSRLAARFDAVEALFDPSHCREDLACLALAAFAVSGNERGGDRCCEEREESDPDEHQHGRDGTAGERVWDDVAVADGRDGDNRPPDAEPDVRKLLRVDH